ncbi:MAG: polysaccharide deacetylase family protein [Planctomycetota bacterium]|nr:polysaccharide deacetylase family protein [Planctomycetota bacterium]
MTLLKLSIIAMVMPLLACGPLAISAEPTLAEKLGYKPTDKLLIINGDDVGMSHSANLATISAMENGLMTSATIMVPCPWFPEIANYAKTHPKSDFGIHLTHTSEWRFYRWGPVASKHLVPGLVDPDGYLWGDEDAVYKASNPKEALIEGRAQIQKALNSGVDVTHIDSHMGTLQLNPDYIDTYLQLALEFNLPARMASAQTLHRFGQSGLREKFAAKGIVFTDNFIYDELPMAKNGVKKFWMQVIKDLKPGVTELYIHAQLTTDEAKAISGSWKTRTEEYETFTTDPDVKKMIKDQGIILIGYHALRDLQRKTSPTRTTPTK